MKRRDFITISVPALLGGAAAAQPDEKPQKPLLAFGVVADPQYADVPAQGSRHYRESIKKLSHAIDAFNKHELKFMVTLGDVIDRDIESFPPMMALYKKSKAPVEFVLGNHDFSVADGDKGKVMDSLEMTKNYGSRSFGQWKFIYLDGNEISTYRHGKNDAETVSAEAMREKFQQENRPQAKSWNGAISKKQMEWIAGELAQASKSNKRVVIFNHFPVFPLSNGHNLWNDKELLELISSCPNVLAYMNGHNHRGHYAVHKGCHYLNFKGMVETQKKNAYAVVRCYADRIEVDGFASEPDRVLK